MSAPKRGGRYCRGVTSLIITKADTDLNGDLPAHLRFSLQLTFSMLSGMFKTDV